jgi:hypothetical protein
MTLRLWLILYVVILFPLTAHADFIFQISSGTAHSFTSTLTIEQPQQTTKISADYDTHPWRPAPYYSVRIGKWNEKTAWEIELIHHKIYLNNPHLPVNSFRVTNGYSMLLLNHAWNYRGFILHAGGGGLVAYPVTTIDNITTSGGYRLAGVAGQGSIERRFFLGKGFFLSAEAKFTMANAWLTLENAKATVPNVAVHGLLSIGYKH